MHSWSFIVPPCTTQQRQDSFSPRTISDSNWLPQPIVMSALVETIQADLTSIKDLFMKRVNNFIIIQLSCTNCDIIFSLLKAVSIS